MKIISIVLEGYRRFLSAGTKRIEYTPEAEIQLITATNGAGKSSLLSELSPLPAQQPHFIKGGFKCITIEHRGSRYVLTSDFSKGNHHLFEKDGIQLNQGRTGSVQKLLVEQEFNYTPEIHDLLLGRIKFCELAPTRRREVLTLLCKTDVTYAMSTYTKLATQARNLVGARKHTEEKIVQYRSSLVAESELFDIRTRLNALQKDYLTLGQSKYRDLNHDRATIVKESLVKLAADLQKQIDPLNRYLLNSDDYLNDIAQLETEIAVTQNLISSLGSEHTALNSLLNELRSNDTRSLTELIHEQSLLQEQLATVNKPDLPPMEYDLVMRQALDLASTVNDMLLKMPRNPGLELYSKTSVPAARTKMQELQRTHLQAEREIKNAEERLHAISIHEKTQCPDCGYQWIPGLSEKEVANLTKLKTDAEQALVVLKPHEDATQEFLNAADEWRLHYSKFRSLTVEYPRLQWLWNYLQDENRIFDEPASQVGFINTWIEQLQIAYTYSSLTQQIERLNDLIATKKKSESTNVGVLQNRLVALEDSLSKATDRLQSLKIELQGVVSEMRLANSIMSQSKTLIETFQLYERALINRDQIAFNQLIDSTMVELSQQMGLLSDKVEKAKHSIDLVAHLDLTLKELNEDEELYVMLLKELSPTEGLIADTLYHFIKILVNQMNEVIRSIWTTKLEIQPCKMDKDQLDYKFPLYFVESEHPVNDLSEGSEGQQDFINFVFRAIARVHLGVQNFPLMIDEVGRSFHEYHRMRLFEYIKKLVELGLTQQVFVVSHFPSTHGTLTLADRVVLDPTGVLITEGDNKCFKIS